MFRKSNNVIANALKGFANINKELEDGIKLAENETKLKLDSLKKQEIDFYKAKKNIENEISDINANVSRAKIAKNNISKLLTEK